jgi:YhcN/YlaJ family sporulation lipoprotein
MNETPLHMPQYHRKEVERIMNKKGITAITVAIMASMLTLTGCMSTDDRVTATPGPTAQSTAQPLTDEAGAVGPVDPSASASPAESIAQDVRSAFNWASESKRATDELNRISEISQSYVAVDDDDAIVGLVFDSGYRGGLTDRIVSMVRQKLVTLDPRLEDIQVTAEPERVEAIRKLTEKLAGGATIDQLDDEFDSIYDQIEGAGKAAR